MNPSDLFVITLPFANGHTVPSPAQLYIPSLNTVPYRLLLITLYLNDLVINEIPLLLNQLEAMSVVDPNPVNFPIQKLCFLTLTRTQPFPEAQQTGFRIYIESFYLLLSTQRTV
jgi:hypothetical protein